MTVYAKLCSRLLPGSVDEVDGPDAIGIRGMTVYALSDAAKSFYEKVGFEPSPLDPHLLMITLADLIDANRALPAA